MSARFAAPKSSGSKPRRAVWVVPTMACLLLGVIIGAGWIGLRVGALDQVPWPQHVAFEGDADAFVQCFEAKAAIARADEVTIVTRFSERLPGTQEVLVQMRGFIGPDGTRSVELTRNSSGFALHDRHFLPEHSPLSEPMSKSDWWVAWRCARASA